ncbi:unnamed protein product, partial [Ectocarpus fasciculatus]
VYRRPRSPERREPAEGGREAVQRLFPGGIGQHYPQGNELQGHHPQRRGREPRKVTLSRITLSVPIQHSGAHPRAG